MKLTRGAGTSERINPINTAARIHTRERITIVDINRTFCTSPSRNTHAGKTIDPVCACPGIITWVSGGAVIYVNITIHTLIIKEYMATCNLNPFLQMQIQIEIQFQNQIQIQI